MKRELLLEKRVKQSLGITDTRRRSSFSVTINQEIDEHKKLVAEENKRIKLQLQRDAELRDAYNYHSIFTGRTSGTFAAIPVSAVPSYVDTDSTSLQELREETLRYRRERDVLRSRLEHLEAHMQRITYEREYLDHRAQQYQDALLEVYNNRVQPMIVVSPTDDAFLKIEGLKQPLSTSNNEDNMDETTP